MTNQTLSTGFPTIDKITGGLHPGKLYVIAGRGGVGKSALAMNIAEHVAASAVWLAIVASRIESCWHKKFHASPEP